MHSNIKPVVLTFTLGAVAFGCADDELIAGPEIPCSKLDQSKCDDGGGADEVGDGDGDGEGDGEAEYENCVADPGDGVRQVHQCNGHLETSIDFRVGKKTCADILGEAGCAETHEFGSDEDDSYSMPAVMACCDAELAPEHEALAYCASDLAGQVCSSVSKRLAALIESIDENKNIPDVAKPEVRKQAKNLLVHINEAQQDCWKALHQPSGPGVIGTVEWKVGNSKNWKLLKDFTVRIDKAIVESVSLPSDGAEILACEGDEWNDNEVFEERGPLSPVLGLDTYHLGDPASVPIMGPRLPDGGHAQGSALVASQSVCAAPRCSALVLGEIDDGVVIEDLDVYADGIAGVAMGEMQLEVDGLALRLYGAVLARPYHGNGGRSFIIDQGAAHFIVTGSIGGTTGARWTENLGPIRLHETADGWMVEDFSVVHTDGLGGAWEAKIPLTTWD